MASPAISAFGTQIKIGDGGSPEAFTTIAELRTISGPSLELETIDVTTHNTPTPWRRFIGGLLNGGEVTFDINFIPTNATHSYSAGLIKDMVNRVQRNWRIVFPDSGNTTWGFPGIVTNFSPSEDPADVMQASVTIKVSGVPELAG